MAFQGNRTSSTAGQATSPATRSRRGGLAGRLTLAAAVTAAAAITASLGFAAAASAATTKTAAATPAAAAHTASGLAWPSGAYLGSNDSPAGAAAFAAWRGRPLDVVDDWSARASWTDITDPAWLYQEWQNQPYTMAFGVAMLPEDVPGVTLAACAAGAYNAHWKSFGSVITSYGLGHSIIRLGWEMNGDWYAWSATQPAVWAKCWQQIVTSARTTAPNLQWDWNVNRGVSAGLANPALAYPGNAYVSMIGVDSYDAWPAATTAAGWQTQLNGTQGLNYWLTFAESHGMKLSVPEWGSVGTGQSAGGDDLAYVTDMHSFFAANAAHVGFEANFQGDPTAADGTDGSYGPGPTVVPNAAAAYKIGF